MPDISLLPPLTQLLGCTADELLGIREPRSEEELAFDERVERIIRESYDDLPPTFDFQKAADYLREQYLRPALGWREFSDSTIRASLNWLMQMDEEGGYRGDPLGSSYRFVFYLRDNVAGICARDDEERRILETQQEAAADSLSECAVGGGVRLITAYHAEKNPERLTREGKPDFLLAEGTREFEGTMYEYAIYVMDGLARSFVCRESHPEHDPDPTIPVSPAAGSMWKGN